MLQVVQQCLARRTKLSNADNATWIVFVFGKFFGGLYEKAENEVYNNFSVSTRRNSSTARGRPPPDGTDEVAEGTKGKNHKNQKNGPELRF